MIDIQNFYFYYKGAKENDPPAINNLNLKINKGDFLGIIGPSGAGKTTLACALGGVIPHHYEGDFYGYVKIKGMDTVNVTPTDISKVLGSVFQDIDGQMVASVVEDEVLFALENFGFPREEIERRLEWALSQTGIADLRYRSLSSLSGGQKQKVAIASIMALNPEILVLDEPTGELDPQASLQIFNILKKLNEEQGTTIIIIEQKIMLLCAYAKQLAVMSKGNLAMMGPVREVLSHSNQLLEIGVNVPRVVSLANTLRANNLYDGETPINIIEAQAMIMEVLA